MIWGVESNYCEVAREGVVLSLVLGIAQFEVLPVLMIVAVVLFVVEIIAHLISVFGSNLVACLD